MLSVVIETLDDEEGLARTLSSLVGGAVEGVVRDVIVCDRGSADETVRIADHAGCVCLEGADIATGIRRAKGDWLMLLEPGARLEAGWIEPVLAHVSSATTPARLTRAEGSPFLTRIFSARRPLADGLVITKRQAAALAKAGGDAASLARVAHPKRLQARLFPAPRRR